jgi:MoaA/NifB/PqqE/SkfB family radical SAM enzyme
MAVSVDGTPELHDHIRGNRSSFDRLAAGVRAVARHRAARGSELPILLGILPITELNVEAVGEAVAALGDLPLDILNLGLRWFVPPEAGARYEAVMKKEFGVAALSWKGFDFAWPGGTEAARSGQLQGLVKLLRGLRRRRVADLLRGRPWLSFLPDIESEDVPAYFTDHGQTFGHGLCPVAWYFAQVESDGGVCFCGDFPDYVIGNVREQSFRDIWKGPRAAAFRDHLAREPLPICARCCGSYVYGRWSRPSATVPASMADPPTPRL